jgi:hypothetical protein
MCYVSFDFIIAVDGKSTGNWREIPKNEKRRCCNMEMKTYQPLNCPLCGVELLSTEDLKQVVQAVGARDGVGKTVLFCEECNTRSGLLIVSDSHQWVLLVVAPAFLDDTFDILIQLREDYGWSIEQIKAFVGSYFPRAFS